MPQKPHRVTVNIPAELREELHIRMKEEHIKSESKFLLSCFLFDLISRCRHAITGQIVNEPDEMFYAVVAEIKKDFQSAERRQSGWLQHRIEELISEMAHRGKGK